MYIYTHIEFTGGTNACSAQYTSCNSKRERATARDRQRHNKGQRCLFRQNFCVRVCVCVGERERERPQEATTHFEAEILFVFVCLRGDARARRDNSAFSGRTSVRVCVREREREPARDNNVFSGRNSVCVCVRERETHTNAHTQQERTTPFQAELLCLCVCMCV